MFHINEEEKDQCKEKISLEMKVWSSGTIFAKMINVTKDFIKILSEIDIYCHCLYTMITFETFMSAS